MEIEELRKIQDDYYELSSLLRNPAHSFNQRRPEGPALDWQSGAALHTLAYLAPAQPVFCELGTSHGYSTIILAYHAKKKKGRVITFERDTRAQAAAK
ncbi:MAG TPA: hypothetical protein VJG90_05045 [Candidatus Nanoarchaeia archaeon]|nr:hypothetical protein [Candidatus Nanoarchaeia archaeon]